MSESIMTLQEKIDMRDRLNREIEAERRKATEERYRKAIELLDISMNEIQLSSGDGVPYFVHATNFIKWATSGRPLPKYIEWNTLVYHVNDVNLLKPIYNMDSVREADKARGL